MFFLQPKKILLITAFFALACSINTHAESGFKAFGKILKSLTPQQIKDPKTIASASLLGGIVLIIYGIFNAYDLPFTLYDNITFALRTHMSEEDLKKHKLANKIKSRAEIIVGSCGIVFALMTLCAMIKAPQMFDPAATT